jgi:membrane protein required for colicin V production
MDLGPALQEVQRFNWLDYVFCVIILYCVLTSFRRGLITQVLGFVGLVTAIYAAGHFTSIGADVLGALHYGGPTLRGTTAFVVTFFVVLIAARAAAIVLSRTARFMMLGLVDHLGGAVFGLLEGVVFVLVIIFVVLHFLAVPHCSPPRCQQPGIVGAVQESRIAAGLGRQGVNVLVRVLPKNLRWMPQTI